MDYYNEFDPEAAAWLEELIRQGELPPGVVDTRSIVDVHPDDLRPFEWCHFFAGIGVWPYALTRVGWPRGRRTWTGSPPCQPFSAAGKGLGVADERHLWPAYFHLIDICRPDDVLGEQVASKDGLAWLDIVRPDMEGAAYAFGVFDLCSAGVGSPNRRQRLYFYGARGLDHTSGSRLERFGGDGDRSTRRPLAFGSIAEAGNPSRMADPYNAERRSDLSAWHDVIRANAGRSQGSGDLGPGRADGGMAFTDGFGREVALQHAGSSGASFGEREADGAGGHGSSDESLGMANAGSVGAQRQCRDGAQENGSLSEAGKNLDSDVSTGGGPDHDGRGVLRGDGLPGDIGWTGPTNGFWRDVDWLGCRDGKWRPVEPGTSPLAAGSPARVGLLRGYGNACNAELATEFAATIRDAEAAGFAPLGDLIELQAIEVEDDLADLLG